jgi:uncharacterized protein YceH (UPF0502 family)
MDPEVQLDTIEARLLAVLVEKALTTAEYYPLTLGAAVNGANQKSNRDPVLDLGEEEVDSALDRLIQKELARRVFPGNSRVDKYCHTGTSTLKIDPAALAVLAELLMRGPQTAAELRTRAGRMIEIDSPDALHELLRILLDHGFIRRVPAGHGSRTDRYAQLLCPDLHPLESAERTRPAAPDRAPNDLSSRVSALETEVERLSGQLRGLAAKLGEPLD